MDVLVRGVSPVIVKKIDRIAKENGMSREEFLREQFEVISIIDLLEEQKREFDLVMDDVRDLLERNFELLINMEEKYSKMVKLFALVMDVELEMLSEYIEKGSA
ncbi:MULTISPECIES: hypothetical protein [Siminovitchia]|uniref:Ribbon-helix-helix protein CopG domain-containing protein n=1 Tax=Siminovitchia sediminis TaxID=1274353 RepID=A0ABW4KB99_9BACI|nr:hypothetical protein [Siminovitchia fortis]